MPTMPLIKVLITPPKVLALYKYNSCYNKIFLIARNAVTVLKLVIPLSFCRGAIGGITVGIMLLLVCVLVVALVVVAVVQRRLQRKVVVLEEDSRNNMI